MLRRLALVLTVAPAVAGPLDAQRVGISAQALGVWHRADRTPEGRSRAELSLVRPIVMARWRPADWLGVRGTVDLEGLTVPDGELAPGAWGEGFVDRRHPHAWLHELVVEVATSPRCGGRRCRFGAFAGRGFVPFGSDDPMVRGFIRYPVNHHLAQILERAVVGGQAGAGPVLLEGALFNGDEPESPSQWPRIGGRFGDSWSLRLSVEPVPGLELRGSAAFVSSPEHRPGAGADQEKRHVGATVQRSLGRHRIDLLAEWARTSELDGFFVFESRLAELGWRRGRVGVRYRYEDTDRPEEERLEPYRTARPHLENSILGITRWRTHTASGSFDLPSPGGGLAAAARVELSAGRIGERRPGAFDLAIYRGRTFRVISIGLEVAMGRAGHSMGRYGVLTEHH